MRAGVVKRANATGIGAGGSSTPIPSVFTPVTSRPKPAPSAGESAVTNVLDSTALNKLQARVMRAEMMGKTDEAARLKAEYEHERLRSEQTMANGGDEGDGYFGVDAASGQVQEVGSAVEVHVLPTLDARGQLYDVGRGGDMRQEQQQAAAAQGPGNRREKKDRFETRDGKTGELLRYNADDDTQTLADLVREERFSAGSAATKNVDAELASRILRDAAYKDTVDYVDENVERLARKNMKTDAMKRQFAIQDFARTKKALDTCAYCWQDEGARPPRANIVASGTRAYLALPEKEPLGENHCLIVPSQHHLSSLELDEDCWDEIKVRSD